MTYCTQGRTKIWAWSAADPLAVSRVKFCLISSRTSVAIADLNQFNKKGISMLWTIIVILIVLWLLGFIGHFGGALIHLLLVIAVVILIINLLQGRRGL